MVSRLNALFSIRTDSRVKKLLGWKQGDEEEKWAEQAINVLVKKLKKQRGSIEDLEQALTTPTAPSKCVTIPRSLDGRLQVSHRKSHPHVIYCRVWRWPDLRSSLELRGLPCCQFPYSSKNPSLDKVCINPYHYERIESAVKLPPVIVTPRREDPCRSSNVFAPENIFPLPNFAALSMYPKLGTVVIDGENSTVPPPYSLQPPPGHGIKIKMEQEEDFFDFAMNENAVKVPFQEVEHWATILYYELCRRVGDQYHCKNNVITIDGFTNPSTEKGRFCLGVLSNLNRNSTIELTRRNIGRGVRITFVNGGVFAECLSECAVFFQSKICNYLHGFHPNTIFKIQPGGSLQIFDFAVFQRVLQDKVALGFDAVYDLIKICSIRMSFVKGWGAEYQRLEVTSTPCWIEIHLHGPLQTIDKVLVAMGSPNYRISSVS